MSRLSRIVACFIAISAIFYINIQANAQVVEPVKVHFDYPVAVPGHLLTPGTYIFNVMDPYDAQNTITIRSVDDNRLVGFFYMIPTDRKMDQNTKIVLHSPDAYGLRTVSEVFMAGEKGGLKFAYQKRDLAKLDQMALNLNSPTPISGF